MRAFQMVGWQHDGELREVPQPDDPTTGQVLIKVAASGVCHSDLHIMHDLPAGLSPWSLPFTLGHEPTGWVEAIGAGVSGLEIGQPVAVYGPFGCGACASCRASFDNYCEHAATLSAAGHGLGADGGHAEYLLVPHARNVLPLGDLDPVRAAPLSDAALTPYHAIARSRDLLIPGSTAVVIGVGGLGHMAVQILKACTPARVVAIDTADDKLALAQQVGADVALHSEPASVLEVRNLTGGRGADLVLDFVGAEATIGLAVGMSRVRGAVTVLGIAGGTYPFGFYTVPNEVSLTTTYWGSARECAEVLALAAEGKIEVHVETFPLEAAGEAYARLAAGRIEGRAVIVP